jgi:hypothetical protein
MSIRSVAAVAVVLAVAACDSSAEGSRTCEGDCAPHAIVEGGQVNAHAIAVAKDNVYWGTQPQGGNPNLLRRASASGGQVSDIATDAGRFELGSNGDAIFFARAGALLRLDAGSTTPTTLVAKLGSTVESIAANASHVYWSNGTDIKRVPTLGGEPETIYSTPQVARIAIDASNVYFAEGINNTLQSVAIDAPSPKTPRTLASQGDTMRFSIWNGTAYFANQREMTIKAVPVTGGTAAVVAETESGPLSIAADATGIYYGTQQGLSHVPLGGGVPEPITASDGQSHMVLDITIAGDHVYWIDYSYQALFRARK